MIGTILIEYEMVTGAKVDNQDKKSSPWGGGSMATDNIVERWTEGPFKLLGDPVWSGSPGGQELGGGDKQGG